MNDCLACLIKPTWMCENCDKVGCCRDHTNTFTIFQAKDCDEGEVVSCAQCRAQVSDNFRGKMHWSTCLKNFLDRPY
jgi:hypothetical protein